jgi:hypothetical protein
VFGSAPCVIPAKAGIHFPWASKIEMDSGFRRNDERGGVATVVWLSGVDRDLRSQANGFRLSPE